MDKLIEIGVKINTSIEAVRKVGLTIEELGEMESYINRQEAIAPLLNPSFIQNFGFKVFDQAKERIRLLKPILELKEKEEGRKT